MDERIAVQTFERAADLKGGLVIAAKEPCRLHHKIGTQTFSAVQGSVMHGLYQLAGPCDLCWTWASVEKHSEPCLDNLGMGGETFFEGIGALGHAGYLARCPLSGNGKFSVGTERISAVRLVICQEDRYDGPSLITDPTSLRLEVEALEQDQQVAPQEERRPRPRIIRVALIALLILVAGPYFLILLYRLDFIRPVSTLMLADVVTLQGYDRRWVDFEDISPNVVRAVMMSEDGQFCNHDGVDWNQLQSVIDDAMAGEATRGASTIPMQTAKNLFLWNGRSFIRKGLELPLAIAADAVWTEAADDGNLLERRGMGAWHLRDRGGGALSLQDLGSQAQPPASSAACRFAAQSDRSRGKPESPDRGLQAASPAVIEGRARAIPVTTSNVFMSRA